MLKQLFKPIKRTFNKNMTGNEQFKKQDSVIHAPEFVVINVNEECFFKCKMCFKWQPDLNIKLSSYRITREDTKKYLTDLRKLVNEGYVVNFAGGEPFLRKDMLEIIKHAASLGFYTTIATNGWLINTEKKAREIVESGLGGIVFSIDGATANTHDNMRGHPGSFEKATQAMKWIGKYRDLLQKEVDFNDRICISIQTVICELNYHEAIDMVNWVDNSDIRSIHFNAVSEPNNTKHDPEWYKNKFAHLWPKDINKFLDVINEIYKRKIMGSKIAETKAQIQAYKNYFMFPDKFVKQGQCNFDKSLTLSSTGDMFLCFNYKSIGNIRNISLTEAWKSYQAESVRNEIRKCKKNCHFLINCFYEED